MRLCEEETTVLLQRRRKGEEEDEEEEGKQKDVASMGCTHEGGAKLLQLLPAAARSLQIWGAQMAGGSPTQPRRGESFTVKP